MSDTDPFGGGDDLIDESVQEVEHSNFEGLKRTFKPWHKPRKQWIREFQWCKHAEDLISEVGEKCESLSYLSLPGNDMLDIRTLHKVCEANEIMLRFLGFNAADEHETQENDRNISHSEVHRLPFVDRQKSQIEWDRIEAIANDRTTAYKKLCSHAPYDIVNIDLCGSIGTTAVYEGRNIFEAVASLIDVQKTTRTEPWLLFLTTRSGKRSVKHSVLRQFIQFIENNCCEHDDFRDALGEKTLLDSEALCDLKCALGTTSDEKFMTLFALGFSKWMLSQANNGHPSWAVNVLDIFAYNVYAEQKDMLSFAFKFTQQRTAAGDASNLTRRTPQINGGFLEEKDQAIQIVEKYSEKIDIDQVIQESPELEQQLIEKSARLLKEARYCDESYKAWVAKGCPS